MAGFWQRVKRCFFDPGPASITAFPTRLSEHNRRPTRPIDSRVINGRVQKRQSSSGGVSPKSRGQSSRDLEKSTKASTRSGASERWPSSCADFTQLLIRVIKRNEKLRLYERQRTDLEQHWDALQQRIDATTLGRERLSEQEATDQVRADLYTLRQALDEQLAAQRKLVTSRTWYGNEIETIGAVQVSEEDDLFSFVDSVMANCKGQPACIIFTPALRERFRDAADIRHLMRREEEQLETLRQDLHALEARPQDGDGSTRSSREAARAVRSLSARIDDLSRATTARYRYKDTVLQSLYSLARQTLFDQALFEPQRGEGKTNRTAEPIIPVDDTPRSPPSLTVAMTRNYKASRKLVEEFRKIHDDFGDTYYPKLYEWHSTFPDVTRTMFDIKWCQDGWEAARRLRLLEIGFKTRQDDALGAGAAPEAMDAWAAHDIRQFAGRHPDDGACSSMSPTVGRMIEYRTKEITPGIYRWMSWAGVAGGHATLDHETPPNLPTRDSVEYNSLNRLLDLPSGERDAIGPWDSASSQERLPRRRTWIDDYRHSRNRPSEG